MSLMELRQLRYFLAVAEQLHFTRAAEHLHVAQPALSLQVRGSQLEEEMGVQLFERLKHRVQLTPAGKAFAHRARFALEQTARAARRSHSSGAWRSRQHLVWLCQLSCLFGSSARLLNSFQSAVPRVNVDLRELDPTEQLEGLRNGSLDLGVMHALAGTTDLELAVIARERLLVALPDAHPSADCSHIDLSSLNNETFLLPRRHEFGGIHEVVIGACRHAGFVPARIQSTRLLQTAICPGRSQSGCCPGARIVSR